MDIQEVPLSCTSPSPSGNTDHGMMQKPVLNVHINSPCDRRITTTQAANAAMRIAPQAGQGQDVAVSRGASLDAAGQGEESAGSSGETSREGMSKKRGGRPARPCKDKRIRMQKHFLALQEAIRNDPFAFNLKAVNLDYVFDEKLRHKMLSKLRRLHNSARREAAAARLRHPMAGV